MSRSLDFLGISSLSLAISAISLASSGAVARSRLSATRHTASPRKKLAERQADLLPVGYFHVVFTLPAAVADIAFHYKALLYDLLFKAASETMLTIAADRKHLDARIGITAVLHTWGSAMAHHPHVHMIVPGGGISLDANRWISSHPAFLLPVRVLGKLFRRLFLGPAGQAARGRTTRLVRRHGAPGRPTRIPAPSEACPEEALGGLGQGALRRAGSGAGLSRPPTFLFGLAGPMLAARRKPVCPRGRSTKIFEILSSPKGLFYLLHRVSSDHKQDLDNVSGTIPSGIVR